MPLTSNDEASTKASIVAGKLKTIYKTNILPAEKRYQYDFFYESPFLTDTEFDAKPSVMLVGQYSVGKTSFIRYMLGRDFPGSRIGPEPTTDRFTCLINGPEERTIPGNALSVHPDFPFRGLERFGVSFLSRFEGSQVPSSVLRSITLVDTPGILSGEKQRVNRGYDFTKVVAWFAERADLILLMFDAHKLDISDELKATIDVLKGHEDKIRCILNKADQINRQQLMRVYGALLWSLGKTISSPEVLRVYVGTFWSEPLQNLDNAELFEQEEKDLMRDLAILPRQSAVRKINELVKRIRKVKALAYIIGYLKSQMPAVMGKEKKQQKLISDMPNVFRTIMKKHNLAPGDFPDINKFSDKLKETKFSEFQTLKMDQIQLLEECLSTHLPQLMEELPSEKDNPETLRAKLGDASIGSVVPLPTRAGKFGKSDENNAQSNPFGASETQDDYWALEESAERLRSSFEALGPVGGFLSPQTAKDVLLKTGLGKEQLRHIWNLSDIDKDGYFDHHEYVVAMFLCDAVIQKGRPIPSELPMSVIPPSKRPLLKERNSELSAIQWSRNKMKSPDRKQKSAPSHIEAINKTSLVSEKLKAIYKDNILPSEKRYQYDFFYDSPYLTDVEFDAKPHVMLIGQYSVGKTSFIKYMLGRDFPGSRIGPEPTTDKFTCLINGPEERTIPGNALSVHPDFPFRGLERFGVSFLSRFEGSQLPSSVLRSITLVDTPGILSGEKQRVNRGYDFTKVAAWFAERCDLILLMFDAHKLDISDELKATIDALKGHEDKTRCILNKADQINRQQLMRVYGALLWSLGKTISSPEVLRVYVGTFWEEPLQSLDNADLFEQEEKDLMRDLAILPRQSAVRKINELVKRIRKVKALAYIIGYLQSQMPTMIGKEKKQQKLIEDLPNVFRIVMKKHSLATGDFPDINKFSEKLKESKFNEFKTLKMDQIQLLDDCLNIHFPRLMEELPSEKDNPETLRAKLSEVNGAGAVPLPTRGGKFGKLDAQSNPFGSTGGAEDYWELEESAERLREAFEALGPVGGFLSPKAAKEVLLKTGLQKDQLREIWNLSDVDRDGYFDHHEYVVAMYLCDEVVTNGRPIPAELPLSVIPPSKRLLIKEVFVDARRES